MQQGNLTIPIGQLEKKVQALNDQITDIFHATTLNLKALSLQLHPNQSNLLHTTLTQSQKDFEHIQSLFKQRASLRLQYLITEQIKEEEGKVRRERLAEYEEKIYDQRRLISDKEAFYEALLKPRKRRPPHMTVEEFQAQRKKEILLEERKGLKRLEDETYDLKQIQKFLTIDNQHLQTILNQLEDEDIPEEELQNLTAAIQQNPSIYDNLSNLIPRRDDKEEMGKLLSNITSIQSSNQTLHKQYFQERQLNQYLRWEHEKLRSQYRVKNEFQMENQAKNKKKIHNVSKYRIKRALSI